MYQATLFDYTRLADPKNQLASVLKLLITTKGVSEQQTPFNGFRSRISDLRLKHQLNIRTIQKEFINQFNRPSKYNVHFLLEGDKQKAIELYNKINQ